MIEVCAFTPIGYQGQLVSVEVDLRRGLPGAEIIGLPDSAVKEAKERVRVAIKNSHYDFPRERLLINLTPANIKKEGSTFDLAIALAILYRSQQLQITQDPTYQILILGELELSGRVRGVRGALSAVAQSLQLGLTYAIVPVENFEEMRAISGLQIYPVASLEEAIHVFTSIAENKVIPTTVLSSSTSAPKKNIYEVDFKDIKGQPLVKRMLEVAASGRHHFLLFGPPGCGKTLSCKAFASILPPLDLEESLEVSQIYSLKNELHQGFITESPFRSPHHSASSEGIIGGGKNILPGEISMAHRGVLFLDEAPEFGKHLLQTLREPLENKRISIARAGQTAWYPAAFQLAMASNVCPCGALGRNDRSCMCSPQQISKYWKRMGSAILDRIDMRMAVNPVEAKTLLEKEEESSEDIQKRVLACRNLQRERYQNEHITTNSELQGEALDTYCQLEPEAEELFLKIMQKLSLSARAGHSVLRVARTVADMAGAVIIGKEHLLEAASYRRYGDNDLYWIDI